MDFILLCCQRAEFKNLWMRVFEGKKMNFLKETAIREEERQETFDGINSPSANG
jgi:hypothetical protein